MQAKPPYGEIADLLRGGNVIPFLGAGVNLGMRQPGDTSWDDKTSTFLPSGAELSRYLAGKINFPSQEERDLSDLAKVASYYVETSARLRLRERLQDIFVRQYTPSEVHRYLASIALHVHEESSPGTPLLVVTTNYDDLTEQAFDELKRPYDLVIYPTERKDIAASVLWWKHGASEAEAIPPSKVNIPLEKTNVIYKMHGSLDRHNRDMGNYVITEDDYVDFLARMTIQAAVPAQFLRHFRTRHFLFLGYGLADWNWRVVQKNLGNFLPSAEDLTPADGKVTMRQTAAQEDDLRSWAIQYRPSPIEIELWNARRVKIFDEDINEFVKGLKEAG